MVAVPRRATAHLAREVHAAWNLGKVEVRRLRTRDDINAAASHLLAPWPPWLSRVFDSALQRPSRLLTKDSDDLSAAHDGSGPPTTAKKPRWQRPQLFRHYGRWSKLRLRKPTGPLTPLTCPRRDCLEVDRITVETTAALAAGDHVRYLDSLVSEPGAIARLRATARDVVAHNAAGERLDTEAAEVARLEYLAREGPLTLRRAVAMFKAGKRLQRSGLIVGAALEKLPLYD